MIDIGAYYQKLAKNEALGEDAVVALLKELSHFRGLAAYLASCQAATLESLPKSTSKSSRERHRSLCQIAAKALHGDISVIKYPEHVESAMKRCEHAVATYGTE